MASPDGGVNIEEVAEKTPENIYKASVKIDQGPSKDDALSLAKGLNLSNDQTEQFIEIFMNLTKLFINYNLCFQTKKLICPNNLLRSCYNKKKGSESSNS